MRRKKDWKSNDFYSVPVVFKCPVKAFEYSRRTIVRSVALIVEDKCWVVNPVDQPMLTKAGYRVIDQMLLNSLHSEV